MIFSQRYVYSRSYTYDEMKVMFVLSQTDGSNDSEFDFEDEMRIVEAVYAHWIDGRDSSEDEKYEKLSQEEVQKFIDDVIPKEEEQNDEDAEDEEEE